MACYFKPLKQLSEQHNVSQWTLLDNFKKLGVRKHTKRTLNKKAFATFTPESCYWAGFLAADGYVWKGYFLGCELSTKDIDHLHKLRNFLKSSADLYYRSREKFGRTINSASIQFNSVELVSDLEANFNITANKSLTYAVPRQVPNHLIKYFIRGYIDGDGSVGWHKHNNAPRLNICSGSQELLDWILKTFQGNIDGIGCPSVLKRLKTNLYTLEFMGHQVTNILQWLPANPKYCMERKSEA